MKALLKREFFILRHNFIPYLCILALMPMAIYICISYPMHTLIKTHSSGINYLHWSSIGNMIFSSSIIGYLISLKLTLRYTEETNFSHAMLASPISNMQHLLSILIWSSIVSFIQLLFSVVITQSLNSSLSTIDILWTILYLLPIIFYCSASGILIALLGLNSIVRTFITVLFVVFFISTTGLFIPIDFASISIFNYSPLHLTILQIQNIVTKDPSSPSPSIIVFVISILVFIISLIMSHRVFKS